MELVLAMDRSIRPFGVNDFADFRNGQSAALLKVGGDGLHFLPDELFGETALTQESRVRLGIFSESAER